MKRKNQVDIAGGRRLRGGRVFPLSFGKLESGGGLGLLCGLERSRGGGKPLCGLLVRFSGKRSGGLDNRCAAAAAAAWS